MGQSQAPDWHCRVLRLGQLWSPSPREEGFVLLLISWLPNSLHILSGWVHSWLVLKGKRARCWGGARLEPGSSSTFVMLKVREEMWDRKLTGLFFFIYFFNWRVIMLQCCVGFCHITRWIIIIILYIASPSTASLPHPNPSLKVIGAPGWAPCVIQRSWFHSEDDLWKLLKKSEGILRMVFCLFVFKLRIFCLCESNTPLCVGSCLSLASLWLYVGGTNGFCCLQKIYQAPWPSCCIMSVLQDLCGVAVKKNRLAVFNLVSVG